MSRDTRAGVRFALGVGAAVGLWWLFKRVWLVKEGTEAEPPAMPAPTRRTSSAHERTDPPDPVDEAIAESFPASDPPSYAGARGGVDVHG